MPTLSSGKPWGEVATLYLDPIDLSLSLSLSLPIQSNEPIGSALHFNVSSIVSWSDSKTFQRILLCGFPPYFIKWTFDVTTKFE